MGWLSRLLRRERLEQELDKELRFHIDTRADELARDGVAPSEARRRALAEFGGVEPIKEHARDARGTRWVGDFVQDLRYALRMLRANKGFTVAAVLSLALGIGANAAVFRVIDGLLLRPLDVPRPQELFVLESSEAKESRFSHPAYRKLAAAAPSATLSVMTRPTSFQTAINGVAELTNAQMVSASWFSVVGVPTAAGRQFTPEEESAAAPVIVISDRFWAKQFGRARSALNSVMLINNTPRTIVGVMPAGFVGINVGTPSDILIPVTAQADVHYRSNAGNEDADEAKPWIPQDGMSWLSIVGRASSAGMAGVWAQLSGRYQQIAADKAKQVEDPGRRERVLRDHLITQSAERGVSSVRQQATPALAVLMGMVVLVLLVACANLANLLLARGAARSREFALRLSIGARRGRLVRQLLTESLALSVLGGAVGLGMAWWGGVALLSMISSGRTPPSIDMPLDWRVISFGLAVTLVTGLGVGLLPALRLSRPELLDAMKSGGRVVTTGRRGRWPLVKVLVGVQVAISLLLLAGAMLFFQTFRNYVRLDPGFDRESVLTARFDTLLAGYREVELPGVYARLLTESQRIAGVRSASLGKVGPATGSATMSSVVIQDYTPAAAEDVVVHEEFIGTSYLSTMGMGLMVGRDFTVSDDARGRKVALINETMAKRFFGKTNPVGRGFGYDETNEFEIVGVVADARANGLRQSVPALVYYPLAQHPEVYARNLYVRVNGAVPAVRTALREAIRVAAPGLAVREIVTLGELSDRTVSGERTISSLAALFSVLGVAVACLGLYGTIAYSVARRTNEIGVRLALGASPSGVWWMVLKETLSIVLVGVAAGRLLMLPLSRALSSQLFGLSGRDPLTLTLASAAVILVGALAGAVPAWRASKVNPTAALRAD